MNKTLYFDCFSGISGDMTLGALVNLGVPREYLESELAKLHIDEEFSLDFMETQKMGITGTRVKVILHNHEHSHSHDSSHGQGHHHIHRNLHSISHIIEGSGISARAKEWALKIFFKVAEAEAHVHGKTLDEVHFHEVGATDSIVDIVGAAVCLDYLNVDRIMASPVEVGGGMVKCAHGLFPVPAPATAEILKGIPCTYGRVLSETTTPTGAAILAAMVDEFSQTPELAVNKIAYGLGQKDFSIPNVLRVMLGATASSSRDSAYVTAHNILIDVNLDDMPAEDLPPVMDKLMAAGALDVTLMPVSMKKSRPAVKLSVLTASDKREACFSIIFKNTTTFGVRVTEVEKVMLPRETREMNTSLGSIRVKTVPNTRKWKFEYEDLRRLSDESGMALPALRARLTAEIEELL